MARLAKNPEVVATELEEGAVLLNMEDGFYYSLNRSGLDVWRMAETAGSVERLVEVAVETLGAKDDAARAAVATFVGGLESARLLVGVDGGGDPPAEIRAPDAGPGVPATFVPPELVKHDEPLRDVAMSPFDPQLPLAE